MSLLLVALLFTDASPDRGGFGPMTGFWAADARSEWQRYRPRKRLWARKEVRSAK